MFKAVGIWSMPKPEDLEAFEQHYVTAHIDSAAGVPNVEKLTLLKAGEGAREAGIYRIAEMYFADEKAFEEASTSEGWATMAADATHMIETFGVEMKAVWGYEEG